MPELHKGITSYTLALTSGHENYDATAFLRDAGGKVIGAATFVRAGKIIPKPSVNAKDNVLHLYFPSESMSAVLDVLRNEKPLQIEMLGDTAYISTSTMEPVGEGE